MLMLQLKPTLGCHVAICGFAVILLVLFLPLLTYTRTLPRYLGAYAYPKIHSGGKIGEQENTTARGKQCDAARRLGKPDLEDIHVTSGHLRALL
ncbi:hypothetical protein V8C40DRAFT_52338 [Trichoderma camerunense]